LDVKKKRALQKAKQNEQIRMEEKRKADVVGGGMQKSEEVARMQMLIHEDVSGGILNMFKLLLFDKYIHRFPLV
jgi:hypothetical protein